MARSRTAAASGESGQSLIETALVIPLLLTIIFNAVNIGFFFFVALNMTTAPRNAVTYSIQGGQTPAQPAVPAAGPSTSTASVSNLVYANITGAISNATDTPVRVCTKALGVTTSSGRLVANCSVFPSTSTAVFATPPPDPEEPYFILHRVDLQYTVSPLIPGGAFNLLLPSSLTFKRQVSMRAMD
jgi:hypothetical protein